MNHAPPADCVRSVATKRCAVWLIGLSIVWLIVLPWLARQPGMHARLDWLDARGIDPSAMYYTELDAMQPILARLNRRR